MKMRMSRVGRASVALAAAVLGMSIVGAAPAYAAEEESTETCWLNLDNDVLQCFENEATFEAAVEEQTGGPVMTGDEAEAAAAARGGVTPMATYVGAIFYENINYGGASLNITTTNPGICTAVFWSNNFPAGWDNRVSSFRSFATCKTRISENLNQGGASLGPIVNASSVGVLNDQASSYWVTG